MFEKIINYFKKLFILIAIYATLILTLVFSGDISTSVQSASKLCINTLIPSLFIFMILANLIAGSKLCKFIGMPFSFFAKYIFKINLHDMGIVLLSLIGGYPVGSRLLGNLVNNKKMSVKKASLMLSYCVNCSPAFLITAVGTAVFSNKTIGIFLYISQVTASFVIGFLVSYKIKALNEKEPPVRQHVYEPYSVLLVRSVNDAIKAMALMCGFVMLFSVISPMLDYLLGGINVTLSKIIGGLFEVTNGCAGLVGFDLNIAIFLVALFTSFAGVCVHMQTFAMLYKSKIKLKYYLKFRILYCFISILITQILIFLFPQAVNCITVSTQMSHKIYSVSPLSSILLFSTCILLLFFSRRYVKIT